MLPSSLFLLVCLLFPFSNSQTFLQILPENTSSGHPIVGDAPVLAYCESWRLSVETNNAGNWKKIPSRCHDAIETYINGPQYLLDSKVAARHANSYAKSIKVAADKKDAWVFDVDETLISNVQHYTVSGYGSKVANETAFDQWVDSAKGAALPWSLWLYRKLLGMGFQLILLTGRKETHRNSTEQNLVSAGYHSWHKLILKESLDAEKTAVAYKSETRAALKSKGYRIHGNTGDQWSDLLGSPMAKRSFKVPNPMNLAPVWMVGVTWQPVVKFLNLSRSLVGLSHFHEKMLR